MSTTDVDSFVGEAPANQPAPAQAAASAPAPKAEVESKPSPTRVVRKATEPSATSNNAAPVAATPVRKVAAVGMRSSAAPVSASSSSSTPSPMTDADRADRAEAFAAAQDMAQPMRAQSGSRQMARPMGNRRPMGRQRSAGGYGGGGNYGGNRDGGYNNRDQREPQIDPDWPTENISGYLEFTKDGHGIVRASYSESDRDAYISSALLRRANLRPGDLITGPARVPKENERFWGFLKVETVNGVPVDEVGDRVRFKNLTPVYPDSQIKLETGDEPLSMRIIDMVAPIGRGQRSLIVSPPKAGKTTLLKDVATGIAANYPEIHIMAVLVGERPEEVTDIRRHIAAITKDKGEVAASNFDESAEDQCRAAELALERAKRLVEMGRDVVILLDSITRLARAYNLAMPTSGRTLSGGFDPAALFPPKKFFGAARNFEVPGSLTIIGTALIDTGSRMDDLVYEEFKGTGNQEVHLDRRLAERRIYPAIDVQRSGTRRDDLLTDPVSYQSILTLHRMLDTLDREERTGMLIEQLRKTKTNKEFLASLKSA